jgi:hypothetical protein
MMSDEALKILQKLLVSRADATGVHCKPPKEKEEEERREK